MNPQTSIEKKVIDTLKSYNLQFDTEVSTVIIKSKIDIVFKQQRIAIFLDGCFWHICPSHFGKHQKKTPMLNTLITRMIPQDQRINRYLKEHNYIVKRYWEHEINNPYIFPLIIDEIKYLATTIPYQYMEIQNLPYH